MHQNFNIKVKMLVTVKTTLQEYYEGGVYSVSYETAKDFIENKLAIEWGKLIEVDFELKEQQPVRPEWSE